MKYDLSIKYQLQNFNEYANKLVNISATVELTRKFKKRTISQNAYLHVLFSIWGLHHGYLLNEAKQEVKEAVGYSYIKKGKRYYKETHKMDSVELTIFIDKFRDWSNITNGYYLLTADEYKEEQIRIQNELKNYY